jgi:hypothetical protein
MPETIAAGDGAPPSAAPAAAVQTPAAPTEGNASVLEYARRKLRQREATGAKPVPRKRDGAAGSTQNQPGASEASPEKPVVLSQAAVAEPEKPDQSEQGDPSEAAPAPSTTPEEPRPADAGEAEEASPADAADDLSIPEDAPDWLQKRIARFTRQKGDLERKLQAAEAERQQLKGEVDRYKSIPPPEAPLPVVVNPTDPAGNILSEAQLEQAHREARFLRRWCEDNPEGGTLQVPDGKGSYQTREFSPEQVRTMKRAAEDDLEEHLPKRREYLRAEQTSTAEALKEFPWLSDQSTPQFRLFKQALANFPAVRLNPDWARATAIFVEGLEARQARLVAAAKPPALPKIKNAPPKVPGAPASAPPRVGPQGALDAQIAAAEKEYKATPNAKTFARLDVLKRQKRQAGG